MDKTLRLCEDGSHTLYSEKAGECYHSIHGALNESLHIFIDAGFKAILKKYQIKQKSSVRILEIGFGTGLNALLTGLEAMQENILVDYTGFEPFPVPEAVWKQLNYCTLLSEKSEKIFSDMHECGWETMHKINPFFNFTKKLQGFMEVNLADNSFDLIYFDAFSPEAQPELWEQEVFDKCFSVMAPEGILVTYCAKGRVKRALKSSGFTVENLPGPAGKREITRAQKLI
jgi:tRNA U34 5-methylaminomethyl-2-thiouridine-forming methyltransferase MnmC